MDQSVGPAGAAAEVFTHSSQAEKPRRVLRKKSPLTKAKFHGRAGRRQAWVIGAGHSCKLGGREPIPLMLYGPIFMHPGTHCLRGLEHRSHLIRILQVGPGKQA
jgi:hypothetical protein